MIKSGNIGYRIRPSERGKGYNHINLFLGLQECQKLGMNQVILIASFSNPASYRTILSMDGILGGNIKQKKEIG